MPDGPGVWPAWWMTDEDVWPRNGEVDILESVNGQTVAKTALHTSDQCDMYSHVPGYAMTGDWEWVSECKPIVSRFFSTNACSPTCTL